MTGPTDSPADGPAQAPMSYETGVEENAEGQFDVVVTTVDDSGARRQTVGTHATREKAELAASVVVRSAKRYEGAADSDPSAPVYDEPRNS